MYTYGHWKCKFEIDINCCVAFLYKLSFNDKIYIGIKKFWKVIFELPIANAKESNWKTYSSSSKVVHRMISEGCEFEYEILEVFVSYADALTREHEILSENDVYNNDTFLNLSKGYSTSRNKLEERRKAISKSIKQLWKDETYRKKTIEGQTGRAGGTLGIKFSDERREKMSKIGKELWSDPDFYDRHVNRTVMKDWLESLTTEEREEYISRVKERSSKIPNFQKGYVMSDEQRKAMSDAKLGTTIPDEVRRKISQKLTGIVRSDEYKAKMSEIKSNSRKRVVEYVEVNHVRFPSLRQAALALNINQDLLKKKCESDEYPDYIVVFVKEADLKKNQNVEYKMKRIDHVVINDVTYNSISDAARCTGESRNKISSKLNSHEFPNYIVYYK